MPWSIQQSTMERVIWDLRIGSLVFSQRLVWLCKSPTNNRACGICKHWPWNFVSINLIDKSRLQGEAFSYAGSGLVWKARLFLFLGFALIAGGVAGSCVSRESRFVCCWHELLIVVCLVCFDYQIHCSSGVCTALHQLWHCRCWTECVDHVEVGKKVEWDDEYYRLIFMLQHRCPVGCSEHARSKWHDALCEGKLRIDMLDGF